MNRLDGPLSRLGISPEALFDHALRGVLVTDAGGTIIYVNPRFCEVTGYSASEVLGKNPRILQSGREVPSFYRLMWKALGERGFWQGEIENRRKNGQLYTEWLEISAVPDSAGQPAFYMGIFSDISRQKQAEMATWHKAHHDGLTGIPNRALFSAFLSQALLQAKRTKSIVAILFLDLDHLKFVNDTLGHSAGDALLRAVTRRVRTTLRSGDVVARFGGDEFVVMLQHLTSYQNVFRIAKKMLLSLRNPFLIDGHDVSGAASIGISVYPDDGQDAETLIAHADAAMYQAKKSGRDQFRVYLSPDSKGVSEKFAEALRTWANALDDLARGRHAPTENSRGPESD